MEGDGLLDAAAAQRLHVGDAGGPRPRFLSVAALEPGQSGVLEVQVRATAPVRTYKRKRGGEGLLARVTLADATGEVDLVLWDDETRLCRDGSLQPGAFVRLHGPTVKAGYRTAVELGLGSCEIAPIAAPTVSGPGGGRTAGSLEGILVAIGDARAVGAPPAVRFTCDLVLRCLGGDVRVTAWDEAVREARSLGLGTRVRVPEAVANPLLDGWWTATDLHAARGASATHK